jgi:hypothetical protein
LAGTYHWELPLRGAVMTRCRDAAPVRAVMLARSRRLRASAGDGDGEISQILGFARRVMRDGWRWGGALVEVLSLRARLGIALAIRVGHLLDEQVRPSLRVVADDPEERQ